ncbi:MAG: alpha/beta hydrolase [Aquabacterium sp.]
MQTPPARLGGLLSDGTHYAVYGQGTPLVFIHGVGMAQEVWAPQVIGFCRQHTVVTYDMLGHGRSPLPPEAPTLGDYAEQLRRLLDQLGLKRAHIVGHSMGALVALEFALRAPERCLSVAALNGVYCRTQAQRDAVMARVHGLKLQSTGAEAAGIEGTLSRWFGEPVPPSLVSAAYVCRHLLNNVQPLGYARTYGLFATSDRAHEGRLAQLQMPSLFMTGEFDPNSTPAMSQAMAQATPQGRCQVLAGERHMMCLTGVPQVHGELQPFLLAAQAGHTDLEAA